MLLELRDLGPCPLPSGEDPSGNTQPDPALTQLYAFPLGLSLSLLRFFVKNLLTIGLEMIVVKLKSHSNLADRKKWQFPQTSLTTLKIMFTYLSIYLKTNAGNPMFVNVILK